MGCAEGRSHQIVLRIEYEGKEYIRLVEDDITIADLKLIVQEQFHIPNCDIILPIKNGIPI